MFSQHILDAIIESPQVSCYLLRRPGTRVNLVQITATPEGICIQGDLVPGEGHGICARKSLFWFVGDLSADYLASKFLATAWHPRIAVETMRSWVVGEDCPEGTDIDGLCSVADDGDQSRLRDLLDAAGIDTSDGLPGWGYDPDAVNLLHRIQVAFAAAWRALAQQAHAAGKLGLRVRQLESEVYELRAELARLRERDAALLTPPTGPTLGPGETTQPMPKVTP